MTDPKYYFGNNPLSPGYDETIPPGFNRWDVEEAFEEFEDWSSNDSENEDEQQDSDFENTEEE